MAVHGRDAEDAGLGAVAELVRSHVDDHLVQVHGDGGRGEGEDQLGLVVHELARHEAAAEVGVVAHVVHLVDFLDEGNGEVSQGASCVEEGGERVVSAASEFLDVPVGVVESQARHVDGKLTINAVTAWDDGETLQGSIIFGDVHSAKQNLTTVRAQVVEPQAVRV